LPYSPVLHLFYPVCHPDLTWSWAFFQIRNVHLHPDPTVNLRVPATCLNMLLGTD
jgi:hypothetical protein